LDEILVGPVPVGVNKFVLQADAPDPSLLPDILGVTVVLVTCSYQEKEFVRIGYYVNNESTVELEEDVAPPAWPQLDLHLVQRAILADKPRVTKFAISWGKEQPTTTTTSAQMQSLVFMPPPVSPMIAEDDNPVEQMDVA
jgi:histone chaperone ASF1